MYRIRGFPPGYDPAVLNANLQVVFNELFNLVNGASRRLRGDHDDDTATLNKSNNRALQRLRGKPASVARVDDLPSDENQRKLKKPTFVDGKPDFVNAKQAGRGIDEPPKSGQVHPILKNANHKGIDAASGALGDHPVFVLGNVPLSEDTIPSTEVLIDSIQDSSGDLVVSPELKESITILTDPNQQSFDESITSATTDPRLVEKVETIEAVVASIEAPADADDTVKADVEAAKAKIQCLLSIVKQTGSPLDAPSSCTPAAAN